MDQYLVLFILGIDHPDFLVNTINSDDDVAASLLRYSFYPEFSSGKIIAVTNY